MVSSLHASYSTGNGITDPYILSLEPRSHNYCNLACMERSGEDMVIKKPLFAMQENSMHHKTSGNVEFLSTTMPLLTKVELPVTIEARIVPRREISCYHDFG